MAKYRFHKVAAVAVLIGVAAWVTTGEFSSVGSAQGEAWGCDLSEGYVRINADYTT